MILVTGDFYFPIIGWKDICRVFPESLFIETIYDACLTQLINEPTRHRVNQNSNILDLVISNDESWITNIEHLPPVGKSDHDVLLISLNVGGQSDAPKRSLNDYNNNAAMRILINVVKLLA